jgi:hypothetical protein
MSPATRHSALKLLAAVAIGGCHPAADIQPGAGKPDAEALAVLQQPAHICNARLKLPSPVLQLPSTDAPKRHAKDDGVDIAQIHTVNRPLQDIGVWNDEADGWSVLTLTLGSGRARSIAVRLHDVKLPEQAQMWLCSVNGKSRQGPYTTATDGQLWSAPVGASQARIEVWTPTVRRDRFSAMLTDVYGGYQ